MTHRSRLTTVCVDVPAKDHESARRFWSSALGKPGDITEAHPEFAQYGEVTPGVEFLVQATGDPQPSTHLDIEADDVEAEVRRLTALGATECDRHHTWVVMRDPVGTVFCVVPVQVAAAFESYATTWD